MSHALHAVLVHPEIPWNTGNVGRTCLAVGAQLHLVRPIGFSLAEKELQRAGLDYWASVQPVIWQEWSELEPRIRELGEPTFFSAEGQRSFWEISFARPSVLVFGSESTGLPHDLRAKHEDHLVRIPVQPGGVRSLNLSTAVALALYEAKRQHFAANQRS